MDNENWNGRGLRKRSRLIEGSEETTKNLSQNCSYSGGD
jgi:hypothetical protein